MKQELKVGLTVVTALIVLGIALFWVKDMRVGSKSVNILFPNVSGLEIGSPVTINGVKQGKVESMQVLKSGVNTRISLAPDVQLYANASARVIMHEVMTGKKVEINPGTADAGPFKDGDIIQGKFTTDIPELVGYAGEAIDTLRLLVSEMQTTLRSTNRLIADPALQEDLKVSVKNMRIITTDLVKLSGDLKDTDIKALISKMDKTLTTLNEITDDLRPELKGTVTDVRATIRNADELIVSLKAITERLQQDKKTLAGKILNDERFMTKLDSVITHIDSLLKLGQDDGINVRMNIF